MGRGGEGSGGERRRDVFEDPPKCRHLETASQIKSLETQHNRTVNRIKKLSIISVSWQLDCKRTRRNLHSSTSKSAH